MPEAQVLEAAGLVKEYGHGTSAVRAVDKVDLSVRRGELVALVGESGSGKSTIGRVLMGLTPPTAGHVLLDGAPVPAHASRRRAQYWRSVQLVFQDPFGCLNPTRTIGQLLSRPYRNFFKMRGERARTEVVKLLESVNLRPGRSFVHHYPHELSGGQRQRVVLARALAVDPAFIIADEPVSMLDVSVRAGVLALIQSVRQARNVGVLYITHDLVSAHQVADRIVVLYGGRVVEEGPAEGIISSPQHPYTQLLLSSVPGARRATLSGRDSGRPLRAPSRNGCNFAPRCPLAMETCLTLAPPSVSLAPGHKAWCHAVAQARASGLEAQAEMPPRR